MTYEITVDEFTPPIGIKNSIPDPEVRQRIIRKALLSRRVEERLLDLFSQGKLFGTVHTCIGQEFSGAVLTEFLQPGDSIFSNHRCHGHFLSFTYDALGLIAEIMGKERGVCNGRGGSQHLCKDGFYSNGIQGGIVPVSAGLALARKFNGAGKISVVFIGDGTLGEGAIYEIFNIASKWELPLLIVLENNGYAQSTNQQETLAGDICARAEAFDIRTGKGDTWNWEKLYSTADELVNFVRNESKPAFLQIDTFRLKAHSKGDDNRPRSEVEQFELRDPLNIMLEEQTHDFQDLLAEINQIVDEAVVAAEESPHASVGTISTEVSIIGWKESKVTKRRLVQSLNETFKELMSQHPKILFIGEDVKSPYGGAFKVSQGLSDLFPERVFNTPISESAVVGMGCGLSMEGYYPIVEIMFGDFMSLTFDQILNHASKFMYMYNDQIATNFVVRTPMGGGRGYGPTHSQTLDRHFMGIPGLRIVALNNLIEPSAVYQPLLAATGGPTLVIENKLLYSLNLREKLPEGFKALISNEQFPTVMVKPDSNVLDVTLIGYGGLSETLVTVADRLFEEADIISQIICPTQIYPFDIKPFAPFLLDSKCLVLIEEGQGFAGFGAEVLAQIAEYNPALLRRVKRIVPQEIPIPASGSAEKEMLPNVNNIFISILEFIHEI
jgi:2-oxoisovalerate dehydrogenase E1 component